MLFRTNLQPLLGAPYDERLVGPTRSQTFLKCVGACEYGVLFRHVMAAVDRPPRSTPSSHAGPSTTSRSVWA